MDDGVYVLADQSAADGGSRPVACWRPGVGPGGVLGFLPDAPTGR